jgi:hypothetical protein
MEANRNRADERGRMEALKSRVRALANNHGWFADELRAAPKKFLAFQKRCEREGPVRKRQLARAVLAQGRLTDPQVTDCTPTLRVRIDGLCPAALANELQKYRKGARLPEALERASAAAALAALDRASKYWGGDLSDDQVLAMEAEHQALRDAATHVQYVWSLDVARPSDWKEPVNPNSLHPDDLKMFDRADYLTIAQLWLGALADAGESRPLVRVPGATGDVETDFRNCMLEKTRSGISTESPQELTLNIAEQMLEEVEKWAKSEAAARGEELTERGTGMSPERVETLTEAIAAEGERGRAAIERIADMIKPLTAKDDVPPPPPKLPKLKSWAWRAWRANQMGMTTTKIAATLAKKCKDPTITQPRVSEQIKRAKLHAEASGLADVAAKVLPQVENRAPARTLDPAAADAGHRTDGRSKHLREKARQIANEE